MIIIETCPKCGHELRDVVITTYPPIPRKECWFCGWFWEGEQEKIVHVPFRGDDFGREEKQSGIQASLKIDLENYRASSCENCPSNPKNGGDGICFCTLGQHIIY